MNPNAATACCESMAIGADCLPVIEMEDSVKRIDVVKKGEGWVAQTADGKTVARAPTKVETVRETADVARKDPQAVTVKIHLETGRIQEERTYPSKADPHKSPG